MNNKKYIAFKFMIAISYALIVVSLILFCLNYYFGFERLNLMWKIVMTVGVMLLFFSIFYAEIIEKQLYLEPYNYSLKSFRNDNFSIYLSNKLKQKGYSFFSKKFKDLKIYYKIEFIKLPKYSYYKYTLYVIINIDELDNKNLEKYQNQIIEILKKDFNKRNHINLSVIFISNDYDKSVELKMNSIKLSFGGIIISCIDKNKKNIYISRINDLLINHKRDYNILYNDIINIFKLK